jgi:hypothetical protein
VRDAPDLRVSFCHQNFRGGQRGNPRQGTECLLKEEVLRQCRNRAATSPHACSRRSEGCRLLEDSAG